MRNHLITWPRDRTNLSSVLGSVMWGQLATRPDLLFSVSLLARFQSNPGIKHWSALMHVLGYIKNTLNYGITYSRDANFPLTHMWMPTMEDAGILVGLPQGMFLSWPVDRSLGAVNDKPLSLNLPLRLNTWRCPNVHNRWSGCRVG